VSKECKKSVNNVRKTSTYELFAKNMNKRFVFLSTALLCLLLSLFFWPIEESAITSSAKVKIALREVGHHLLLANQDSSSRVLPIVEVEDLKYRLSFQEELPIMPQELLNRVEKQFQKHALPTEYRIEVLQCSDGEVAYSYERSPEKEGEISCGGRPLPSACYNIELAFGEASPLSGNVKVLLAFILIVALFLFLLPGREVKAKKSSKEQETYAPIGNFRFYPKESKLVKQAEEISLSQKECELLQLFISRPNELITRDELSKKVWEDKGVIVGRSLDTYISKLRKKLKGDERIKLSNVHGVGYKLEC
jgi:DNA-binding response OmpR family regulator